MKKILFALLLVPMCCSAQIEVGVNDGITPFKLINTYQSDNHLPIKTNGIYDLSISYKIRSIKLGVGYSDTKLSYASVKPRTPVYYQGSGYSYAQPISNIYLYADHENNIGRSSFYEGLSVGYVTGTASVYHLSDINPVPNTNYKVDGVSVGAQIGYTYNVWKGICINAQVGATYMSNKMHGDKYSSNATSTLICFPITAGVHYKLPSFRKK